MDAARAALPDADEWEVTGATAGPAGQVALIPGDLPADLWVWRVSLRRGDRGAYVMIDFVDGSVLGKVDSIID